MLVSVITITKGRPETMPLCERWYAHQDYQGESEHVIERERTYNDGLERVYKRARGDYIVFMEDDDYYGPGWVSWCVERLQRHGIERAGQLPGRMYHMPTGAQYVAGKNPQKPGKTWMLASAVKRSELPRLINLAKAGKSSCAGIWKPKGEEGGNKCLEPGDDIISLKGMPGFHNVECPDKHAPDHKVWGKGTLTDPGRETLREWIGNDDDWQLYMDMIEKHGWPA